jgi:WXG100 family type VII secretion target
MIMAGSMLSYPPEIVDAVATMQRAATQLDQEMADLKRLVDGLVGSSKGTAIQAFNEVQQLWNKSGLNHNETLNAVAKAAGDSHDAVTSFDSYLANQLQH